MFPSSLVIINKLLVYLVFSFSNIAYAALMASVSLMFGSLAHFYEKPVVVIATACAGSLAVLYGKHGLRRKRRIILRFYDQQIAIYFKT